MATTRKSSKSTASIASKSSSTTLILGKTDYSITTSIIIGILYNILILGYIIKLENKQCGCIIDWRHDFIKYFSISTIIWGLLSLAFNLSTNKNEFVSLLKNILMIASIFEIWCLYTYVGDLDKTKCICAIDKQKNMHYFLYIWRYVLVGTLILAILGVIAVTLTTM